MKNLIATTKKNIKDFRNLEIKKDQKKAVKGGIIIEDAYEL